MQAFACDNRLASADARDASKLWRIDVADGFATVKRRSPNYFDPSDQRSPSLSTAAA
jgi:hypothetical protein